MIITTYAQLEDYISGKCEVALDRTMDRLLDKLEEFIKNDVYEKYTPSFYDRTLDFQNSWEKTKATIKENMIESEIFQNVSKLSFNSDKFQHGSGDTWVENWNNNPNELAHIINDGAIGHAFGFPPAGLGARPFWNNFVNFCETNFEEYFRQELSKII